jgi:ankyrin repeat protein
MKCHDEVVALLLQYGASPILLTKDGRTALHLAVSVSAEELQQGKVTLAALESVVEQLLSVAPSLASMHSQNGRLPIHMAAQAGHATVVRKLLAYAPDTVTVRDHGGVDPFLAACIGGHISIARELLKYPAVSANSADKTGRNALHLAAMIGHIEILDEALQVWHLPLDQPDHWDGWTPFHYAAKEGRTVVIQHMLTFATVSGMDIVKILDIRDRHQRTASDVGK